MSKDWENLAESLSVEIKREIAENYFNEKNYLEEEWEHYQKDLFKKLQKQEERVILNGCRMLILLGEKELWDEFEKITGFSLKNFYDSQILKSYGIKKSLFKKLKAPFGFSSKNKFVKLFINIYRDLETAIRDFLKELNEIKKYYERLKGETQAFYQRFDLSAILGFFRRLEGGSFNIGPIEPMEKTYETLAETLKIKIPPSPEEMVEKVKPIPPFSEVSSEIIRLAKKAFEKHQKEAREIIELVSKKT
ncbi:MAG: hypothetical protein N3A56_01545 [Thermodesulfobacteriaceae bacterium]|nr:hypothetical protein [Thermodesulfobacteriaceae bacterium]